MGIISVVCNVSHVVIFKKKVAMVIYYIVQK